MLATASTTRYACAALLLCACISSPLAGAADSINNRDSLPGFIDVNTYPHLSDVDSDNSLTINMGLQLPQRFSYFSLTNFGSSDGEGELKKLDTYYTEQNIRWQIAEDSPLDLTLQLNFRSGDHNDRQRLGMRWRLNNTPALAGFFDDIHLNYSINWHALQFDHEDAQVWQLEHVFRLSFPYISDRLYLAGFIDHTFNQDLPDSHPDNPIVGEAQLGLRLVDQLYLIGEYRVNEYRRSDVNNLALGLEYTIKW